MKKFLYLSILAYMIMLSGSVNANITITGGTSHGNSMQIPLDSNGFNLKYRYEVDSYPISLMGSLIYTECSAFSKRFYLKSQYGSIDAAPVYRLNHWASIYGGIGLGFSKFHSKHIIFTNNQFSFNDFGIALIAGMQFNPTKHFIIDLGYERTIMHQYNINNIFAGIGYIF
ncbi:Ail/Lom family outer membrane beta-barrel protein [Candidatus Pantoea edessiphila]|nr:Ail/Lom family outer membrane beta-barrel protein [Candidatus Pantoea edessiphila]